MPGTVRGVSNLKVHILEVASQSPEAPEGKVKGLFEGLFQNPFSTQFTRRSGHVSGPRFGANRLRVQSTVQSTAVTKVIQLGHMNLSQRDHSEFG
jgi:hypothetical protein